MRVRCRRFWVAPARAELMSAATQSNTASADGVLRDSAQDLWISVPSCFSCLCGDYFSHEFTTDQSSQRSHGAYSFQRLLDEESNRLPNRTENRNCDGYIPFNRPGGTHGFPDWQSMVRSPSSTPRCWTLYFFMAVIEASLCPGGPDVRARIGRGSGSFFLLHATISGDRRGMRRSVKRRSLQAISCECWKLSIIICR